MDNDGFSRKKSLVCSWAAANADISFEAITKGTNVSSVPKGTYFFLFKINALDKFGDSCWFTLVYNNVIPNGLYENLGLPAKPTDRFGMLAPLGAPGSDGKKAQMH